MEYRVSVILRVETVLYTGRVGDPVKRLHIDRLVRPGVLEEIRMDVSWEEYGPRLLDQCAFNIACLATVKDTNFEYFAQDDFRVRKPDIKITVIIRLYIYYQNSCQWKKVRLTKENRYGTIDIYIILCKNLISWFSCITMQSSVTLLTLRPSFAIHCQFLWRRVDSLSKDRV